MNPSKRTINTEPAHAPPPMSACALLPVVLDPGSTTEAMYERLEDAGCPLAPPIRDRIRFETLLADLSATFVKVSADQVDAHILAGLRQIVECLGIDRSGFGQLVPDENSIAITHSYQVVGVPPTAKVLLKTQFLVYARKILEGAPFRLPDDIQDIEEAVAEREYLSQSGLKSQLTIPLKMNGAVVGGIGFASFRSRIEWPDELVRRFHLVGDIFTNALARKQAGEAIRLANRQANVLRNELAHATRVELVSHLTTSIAHEVNQPLFAIASNAQTASDLLSMGDIEEAKKALEDIWADARRASEVIGRVRGMVKKDEPRRVPIPLATVFDELLSLLQREASAKAAALRINLDARDIKVVCDRVQLQQVLINLLLNAVEAISEARFGPREVVIRVWREDAQWARISFQDTGVGLSKDDCERVFTPFFTTKAKGLGLGLSISRSLIEAHGGKLWATPGVERGTLFHIRLPMSGGQP